MKHPKTFPVIGSIFVLLTGTLAHFVYAWSRENRIIGLFTPVNESVWEHMKLLFFPMLLFSLPAIRKYRNDYPGIAPALFSGILTGTLLIPVFFYSYTCVLGRNLFLLDMATFILSILTAFYLSYRLALSCRPGPYTPLLLALVCILGLCFAIFTYHPPNLEIFEVPAVRNA